MSDLPVEESVHSNTPGRFSWLNRLLQRFGRGKETPAAAEAETAAPAEAGGPRLRQWLQRLRRFRQGSPADSSAEVPTEAPAEAAGDEPPAAADEEAEPGRWQSLFDSPVKIALFAGGLLVLVLLVVLVVVLLVKKPARPKPAAAPQPAAARAAATEAGHVKAVPVAAPPHATAGHPPTAETAKPAEAATDPLAEERARLEQLKTELETQRAQLEADKKAFAEQAGRQTNGAVVSRRPGSDLAGSCELTGSKGTLRDNLRACLGLPPKPAAEPAKAEGAAPQADAKPASAAHH